MTTFAYVAVEPSGRKRTGFVEAPDKETALAKLSAEGTYPLELKEKKGAAKEERPSSGRVGRQELALFTRRLADLASAGLPLDRAMQVVGEQSESAFLAYVAGQALEDVRGGLPVSQALAKFPKLFPPVYTQTLAAGEASGQFADVATRLADFQEKEVARRSQIMSALIYPGVLTVFAVFVVLFLLYFVVPRLAGVFTDLQTAGELPAPTKALLATTDFLTTNWLPILGAVAGAAIAFRLWSATEAGAYWRDSLILRMPLMGKVVTKAVISRYARVLGTLVFGGVPILDALKLSGLASGNKVFEKTSDKVEQDVREGRTIHDAMRDAGAFPPVLTHMVAIGEETGDLPKMLGRVSDSLDFEVDTSLRRLTSLVEPIIVLAMGGFVGFVVLSVLLPIYQAQNLVK
jgi:type II secretory pathway component PulF